MTTIDAQLNHFEEMSRAMAWLVEQERLRALPPARIVDEHGMAQALLSAVLPELRLEMDDKISRAIETEAAEAIARARGVDGKKRIAVLEKMAARAEELRRQMTHPMRVDGVLWALRSYAHGAKVDEYLQPAREEEFSGERDRALDRYRGTVEFLRAEAHPSTTPLIGAIEARLHALDEGVACAHCGQPVALGKKVCNVTRSPKACCLRPAVVPSTRLAAGRALA